MRARGTALDSPTSKAMIWLLSLMPMLAPINTPTAFQKVNKWAFTSTMVRMITAEEELSTMVTTTPRASALSTCPVQRFNHFSSREAARLRNAAESMSSEYKNTHSRFAFYSDGATAKRRWTLTRSMGSWAARGRHGDPVPWR